MNQLEQWAKNGVIDMRLPDTALEEVEMAGDKQRAETFGLQFNPMKTDTKFNSGPLSRAVAALLLAFVVAALCLVPVTGTAQILVANQGNNTIGEYDATTGAPINRSFISSGSFASDIAVSGGNRLLQSLTLSTTELANSTPSPGQRSTTPLFLFRPLIVS
jgi:hypothetical protein